MAINYRDLYFSIYEARGGDDREMRRLAAQERRAGNSDRMDSKAANKYADSEAKSAEREDKKSKGKHIHGMADSVELEGDLVDEGMTMKDFKANRSKIKRREASADAKKRGHVGKEWYNSGTRYSPDEAKRMRSNLDDEERSTRHRSAVDPEGDDSNYSADKTKNPKKLRKQKAMGESAVPGKPAEKLGAVTAIPKAERDAARERALAKAKAMREKQSKNEEFVVEEDPCWKGYTQVGMKKKGGREVPNCVPSKGVPKAKGYKKEQLELDERTLSTAETGEKERLVKGMKKSAAGFKERYGKRATSVIYATATKMAKEHVEESADVENRNKGPRKPSQLAKREKLNKIINDIRSKKEGESN
jgi:hypothetical protein